MSKNEKAKQALTEAVEEITGEVICNTDYNLLDTDHTFDEIDLLNVFMLIEEKLSIEEIDIVENELSPHTPIEEIIRIIESKL